MIPPVPACRAIRSRPFPLSSARVAVLASLLAGAFGSAHAACGDAVGQRLLFANGGDACSAVQSSYPGSLNVGYAAGAGSVLTFTQPSVTVSSTGPAVYVLSSGGSNGGPGGPGATIRAQNLTVNAPASSGTSRALYIFGGTGGGQRSKVLISGNLTATRGTGGSAFENNGGELDVAGETTMTTVGADVVRQSGADGQSVFHGPASFTSSGPASTGMGMFVTGTGLLQFLDTVSVNTVNGRGVNMTAGRFDAQGSSASVTASGDNTGAVAVSGTGDFGTLGVATLTANGANSVAVSVAGTGKVELGPGSVINATNATGTGVRISNTGQFTGGAGLSINAGATSLSFVGSSSTITLPSATATVAPTVFAADAASNATLVANGGHYKGASQLASGGQLNVNLASSALWEVTAASTFSTVSLQSDATLDASLLPTLAVTGNLSNAGGVVSLARTDSTPTNTLAVTGNYTANGGTLALNTVLNDAGTSTSDVLQADAVVAGGTPTLISIAPDAASHPALTTGDGILVVRVNGGVLASDANAFALPGGYLDAGGVRYVLVRNAGNGNWYLQATQLVPGPGTPVPTLHPLALLALGMGLAACVGWRRKGVKQE